MKRSTLNDGKKGEKKSEPEVTKLWEVWPLSTMLELSQKILDKGVVRGNEVFLPERDRRKLLSYSAKIEPILQRIKATQGEQAEPLERVIHAWREKMQYFGRHANKRSR